MEYYAACKMWHSVTWPFVHRKLFAKNTNWRIMADLLFVMPATFSFSEYSILKKDNVFQWNALFSVFRTILHSCNSRSRNYAWPLVERRKLFAKTAKVANPGWPLFSWPHNDLWFLECYINSIFPYKNHNLPLLPAIFHSQICLQ